MSAHSHKHKHHGCCSHQKVILRILLAAILSVSFAVRADDVQVGTVSIEPGAPAPQPQDRAKSQAAAKALAMGSAAMSKVQCFQMMSEARKMEGSDKALMMMVAQQACAQGDAMLQSALENDKGQKQLTQNDIPKQAKLTATGNKLQAQGDSEDEKLIDGLDRVAVDDSPLKLGDLPTGQFIPDEVREQELPEAASVPEVTEEIAVNPDLGKSALDPISGSSLGFEENGKGAGGTGSTLALGTAGSPSGSAGSGSAAGDRGIASAAGDAKRESGRRDRSLPVEGGETGGGSGGSSKGPGASTADLDAMLAQLMGQPPGAEGGTLIGGEILSSRTAGGKGDIPNIFEYATYRYKKHAHEDGRIRLTPLKRGKVPSVRQVSREGRQAARRPASRPLKLPVSVKFTLPVTKTASALSRP